jgi:hypothetical protein
MINEITKLNNLYRYYSKEYGQLDYAEVRDDIDIVIYDIAMTGKDYNQIVYDEYNIIDIFEGMDEGSAAEGSEYAEPMRPGHGFVHAPEPMGPGHGFGYSHESEGRHPGIQTRSRKGKQTESEYAPVEKGFWEGSPYAEPVGQGFWKGSEYAEPVGEGFWKGSEYVEPVGHGFGYAPHESEGRHLGKHTKSRKGKQTESEYAPVEKGFWEGSPYDEPVGQGQGFQFADEVPVGFGYAPHESEGRHLGKHTKSRKGKQTESKHASVEQTGRRQTGRRVSDDIFDEPVKKGAWDWDDSDVLGGGGNDNNLIYIVEIIVIAIIALLQYNISSEERLKQDKWELIYDEKNIYKTTSILEYNVDHKIFLLFSKYNSIIEKLKKFLINPTIRINEKDYHSETIEYIQNYIKQFEKAIHNPQTKEILKKKLYPLKNNYTLFNEELFKWVPSNLFFYSKDMNTSIYQIEEEYYTPLQIPKLFKYLDDGLVFEIFGIENTFLGHETFYELVIHELKINEHIESTIQLQHKYGFKLLLYFLEIKYSLIMNDDGDGDTLITNYKNTNYLKNIKYFKKNGVSIENSIYFADILCDVISRNILKCDELVFEILREFGGNDLYVSYSFYNEYLPYFFVDVTYIYSIDLFYNIIQVFNNPVDSISIYKQIEIVRYEHKNKTLKKSLKCLCDEPGIKKIKNVDMLISLCVKNKNNIDNSYLTTFIDSLKLLPYKFIKENLTEIDRITETILKNVDSHKKTHISKKTLKHKLKNLSKKIEMIRKHSKTQTTRYINPTKRRINSITKRRLNSITKKPVNSITKKRINSKRRINSRTQKHLPNLPIIYGHG